MIDLTTILNITIAVILADLTVIGLKEFYVSHKILITPQYYKKLKVYDKNKEHGY